MSRDVGKREGGPPARPPPDHVLTEIESRLGWKLATRERADALRRAAAGESADALADWYQRYETARTELNDPAVRTEEFPPARGEGSDPRRAAPQHEARYKP